MKSIKLCLMTSLLAIAGPALYAQGVSSTCTTVNNVPKITATNVLGCSLISDNGTTVGIASSANSYFLTNITAARNDSRLFVDGSGIGSFAHVMIKGNTSSSNYPTLGFGLINSASKTILGASLTGLITNSGAGTETMDLTFSTKPTGNVAQTERMRITSVGKVAVGLTSPAAQLDVYKAAVGTELQSVGINVHNADLTTGSTINGGTGISVLADNSSAGGNIGALITASNASALNMGVWSTASGPGTSGTNYGVIGTASGNTNNYGIYGSVPSGTHPNNCAGYFNGDVFTTGTYNTSDEKLKTNAQDFKDALTLLKKLEPKSYSYKTDEYKNVLNLPEGTQIGIMAQNVQAVFPNLVKEKVASTLPDMKNPKTTPDVKFLAVNYVGLVPVLVEAVKELSSDLEQTKKDNADLRQQLNDICNGGCASLKGNSTTDPSTTAPNQLLQNVPNPFAGQTTVNYVLNSGTIAYLNVNALDGKQIKQIPLTVKGQGSVTINGSELGSGTYTYTLYVDGTAIDTKLMVIANK